MEPDWHIIGGEHHGERHQTKHGDTLQLIRRVPMSMPSMATTPETVSMPPSDEYRLARFHSAENTYRVWVPAGVPKGAEMAHVLSYALRK